jgi:hypothetical protein
MNGRGLWQNIPNAISIAIEWNPFGLEEICEFVHEGVILRVVVTRDNAKLSMRVSTSRHRKDGTLTHRRRSSFLSFAKTCAAHRLPECSPVIWSKLSRKERSSRARVSECRAM